MTMTTIQLLILAVFALPTVAAVFLTWRELF